MRRSAVLLALCLLAACAASDDDTGGVALQGEVTTPSTITITEATSKEYPGPPPAIVTGGDKRLVLRPWTFCFGGLCADGSPPDEPLDIESADSVHVQFAEPGWSFTADFSPVGVDCPQSLPATLTREGPNDFRLDPHGPPGDYGITLAGRGDENAEHGGDSFYTFRWHTTTAGPVPDPVATTSIIADHDGEMDSYGVEMNVSYLASTPTTASATVAVTAANGASVSIELTNSPPPCWAGAVMLRGSTEHGVAAAALGDPPFRYDVTLHLDGAEYRATANWPQDVDPECSPCVPLHFSPDLPDLPDPS